MCTDIHLLIILICSVSLYRDVSDFTPLHLVAIHGSVEIAKLLIKHGASVNPKGATKKDFVSSNV